MESRAVVALVNPRHSRATSQARAIVQWSVAAGLTVARTADPTPEEIGDAAEAVRQGEVAGVVVVRLDVLGDLPQQEAVRSVIQHLGGRIFVVDPADAQQEEAPSGVREMLRLYDEHVSVLGGQAARARLHRGAARTRAERGRAGGRTPYGWRMVAGEMVEDAQEQAARTRIRVLWQEGHSYSTIGRQLGVEGYRRRDGGTGPWHPDTVRRIILRMQADDAKSAAV